jgi:hypothetical protein
MLGYVFPDIFSLALFLKYLISEAIKGLETCSSPAISCCVIPLARMDRTRSLRHEILSASVFNLLAYFLLDIMACQLYYYLSACLFEKMNIANLTAILELD